jgi:hypothetical protein
VSVSTEPQSQQTPPRGPGGIKRETYIWAAAVLLVLVLGFALAALVANRRVNDKEKGVLLGQEQAGGVITAIGPLNGNDLTQYIPTRKDALLKASGDRVAVVSLDRYATVNEAKGAVGNLKVIAMLAAPPGGVPSVVKGDIGAWAKEQKDAAVAERDQTRELVKTVDDPDYKPFYLGEITRLDKLIASINPAGPNVFALVVEGPAADLQRLGQTPGIRLVDVGPSTKISDDTDYHGARPEQSGTVDQNAPRPF